MNSPSQPALHYRIHPSNPAAHLFEVAVTVTGPDPAGQCFMLPAWIPGSYMIREFARHIVSIRAEADGKPIDCIKIDKPNEHVNPATLAAWTMLANELLNLDEVLTK